MPDYVGTYPPKNWYRAFAYWSCDQACFCAQRSVGALVSQHKLKGTRSMEKFTTEQMRIAERLAIETGFEQIFTPIDALRALTHCLFCVVQGTVTPQYTEKQMSEACVFMLQHYPLSEDFPYSNREIIKDILRRRTQNNKEP